MPKVLLDTDILSEYLKGYNQSVVRRAREYAGEHGVFTFTSVTVHEITFGLEMKGATAQLKEAFLWLDRNEEITPTASDYIHAARIRASAGRVGSVLQLADCLIAGRDSPRPPARYGQHE